MKQKVVVVLLILVLGVTTLVSAQSDSHQTVHVGRQTADLKLVNSRDVGDIEFWNTRYNFNMEMELEDDWHVRRVWAYAGKDLPPTYWNGRPRVWKFNCKRSYRKPVDRAMVTCNLKDELDFTWGGERQANVAVYAYLVKLNSRGRIIRRKMAWAYFEPTSIKWDGARWGWYWTTEFTHPARGHFIDSPVGGAKYGTPTQNGKTDLGGGFDYFPGEVVDIEVGPVKLGSTVANHKISPLDLFENADIDDERVINMARFLQSLDHDADPKKGIDISDEVLVCLDEAYQDSGLTEVDFANDAQVTSLIEGTVDACEGEVDLAIVSAEDAKENLDKSLNSNMFRKNISRSPELTSSKSKLNIMTMWFPALKANGEPASFLNDAEVVEEGVPYYDADGALIRVATEAKPVVVAYTDGVEETGEEDVFAAISRDDGNTFKRMNLSRAADKSSFELEDGTPYYGQVKKPVFHVKGNNILVAWTSKFCKGGKPTYAINTCDDPATEEVEADDPLTEINECAVYCKGKEEDGTVECEPDDPSDDVYYEEDIWGVGGNQRSVDYADQDFPEVGEVPYSCVWTARGIIVTQGMINKGGFWQWTAEEEQAYFDENGVLPDDKYVVGDIVWYKPERLTSGRRDANQAFMGASDDAGFAVAWQEDPKGLRPGDAAGPGPGWGGATTNHKTDIWYSYITWEDFAKVDTNFESGGDPEHDIDTVGRPKALVPMSLPVRLSDNDVVNTDNLMVELDPVTGLPVEDSDGNWTPITNPDTSGDGTGSHAYGYKVDGLCEDFYTFTNQQEEVKNVCITEDGRLLDGNTGASRPNLFLQTYKKPDGSKSAWAIMAYEETKGVGSGPPYWVDAEEKVSGPHGDDFVPDAGKNAIYLSFDFQKPDVVSAGTTLNLPELDEDGNLVYLHAAVYDENAFGEGLGGMVDSGELLLDYQGNSMLAYENARRPRFILQGKSAKGASGTVLLILYKEGQEGQGRPSDIMMRRVKASPTGNPYAPANLICNATAVAENGQTVCVDGSLNMSSVTPTETWINPDRDDNARGEGTKVIRWDQTIENLNDRSDTNPYDDARAHRGQIRGDFVAMGFSYTPNWAASRNGHDKYDLYVRRSFDGGVTWTTDPAADPAEEYGHCITWTIYEEGDLEPETEEEENGKPKEEECFTFDPGVFERMRNVSQLPNNKESVIEPRIVAPSGTIKTPGTTTWTGIPEDKQNKDVFYVSYGTSTNPGQIHGSSDEEPEFPAPADLYYSFSQDRGQNYVEVSWIVNPDSSGPNAGEEVTRWDWMAKGDPEQGEAQLRMTPDGSRFYATWLQEGEEGSDIWFRRIMSPAFPANNATTSSPLSAILGYDVNDIVVPDPE